MPKPAECDIHFEYAEDAKGEVDTFRASCAGECKPLYTKGGNQLGLNCTLITPVKFESGGFVPIGPAECVCIIVDSTCTIKFTEDPDHKGQLKAAECSSKMCTVYKKVEAPKVKPPKVQPAPTYEKVGARHACSLYIDHAAGHQVKCGCWRH
jgi:hypothetical protein